MEYTELEIELWDKCTHTYALTFFSENSIVWSSFVLNILNLLCLVFLNMDIKHLFPYGLYC